MADKNTPQTTITHPNGYVQTFNYNDPKVAALWENFLQTETKWELATYEREMEHDMRPMLLDYHKGRREPTYDYLDYGVGAEGTTEEIEDAIAHLDTVDTKVRFELRATYLSAKGKCDASKRGTVPYFSWKVHWTDAKAQMRTLRTTLKEIAHVRRILVGELRARSAESHPEHTRYYTCDLVPTEPTEMLSEHSLVCEGDEHTLQPMYYSAAEPPKGATAAYLRPGPRTPGESAAVIRRQPTL